jgi:hypothetical protein
MIQRFWGDPMGLFAMLSMMMETKKAMEMAVEKQKDIAWW